MKKTALTILREKTGLTMAETAKLSNTPYATWRQWENGTNRTPNIAISWLNLYASIKSILPKV